MVFEWTLTMPQVFLEVTVFRGTQHHIPEDLNLQIHCSPFSVSEYVSFLFQLLGYVAFEDSSLLSCYAVSTDSDLSEGPQCLVLQAQAALGEYKVRQKLNHQVFGYEIVKFRNGFLSEKLCEESDTFPVIGRAHLHGQSSPYLFALCTFTTAKATIALTAEYSRHHKCCKNLEMM
jgi:hypothetical protein